MSERAVPFSPSTAIADARDDYLAENGFTFEGYSAPRTKASLLGLESPVPNPPRHAWGIMRHDLHHVVTGFGTDLAGEGEVSAFEARTYWSNRGYDGLNLYTNGLVLLGLVTGLVVAPLRTIRAWRLAARCGSLFRDPAEYEELLRGTVADLRTRLGVPREGLAEARGLHSTAPARRTA